MGYRNIGRGIRLVASDYRQPELVLASEKIVKETLAIKIDNEYILADDDNIDYYSIVDKYGMNSFAFNAIKVGLGTLAGTLARRKFGDGRQEKLIFIKMKTGKRLLVIVNEGFAHLIRSRNKRQKEMMDEKDKDWTLNVLKKNDIGWYIDDTPST